MEKSSARLAADAHDKIKRMESGIPDAREKAANKEEGKVRARISALVGDLPEEARQTLFKLSNDIAQRYGTPEPVEVTFE